MSDERELKYTEALAELEGIIKEMESEEIDIDTLTEKVKRADYLCRFCLNRLRKVEDEVRSIMKNIESTKDSNNLL